LVFGNFIFVFGFRVGFVMLKKIFFLLIFITNIANSISFWTERKLKKAYKNSDFKKVTKILAKEQAKDPNNPYLSYNLATAYYGLGNFNIAKVNFERCINDSNKTKKNLRQKAFFNWGNSLYKIALKLLGDNWEEKGVIAGILQQALEQIKSSIEKYDQVLILNEEHKKAKKNKKIAEDLLKKLQEKMENNSQQNKNKESSSSKDQESENGSFQEHQKDDQSQNSNQEKEGQDGSDDSQKNSDEREYKEFDGEQASQKEDNVNKRKQDYSSQKNLQQSEEQASQEKDNNPDSENQESSFDDENSNNKKGLSVGNEEQNKPKTVKEKMLQAVLDNLQDYESEMQKALIRYKTNRQKVNLNSGQKPW
jgi:hypothetical protein